MEQYRYSQLSLPNSIRLLRLLPSEDTNNNIRCELFEYSLVDRGKPSHPYEALSYVWGSENKPKSITINNRSLHITQNLYAVLLHLQDHICSRVIWIDAICINQANDKEKEKQLPLMAEIYAKARHVLVWLGEAGNDSDRAFEAIRLMADNPARSSIAELAQQAVLQLLQRPWFRRIWVLQEMAAARDVLMMYGSSEIDGYAFCAGLAAITHSTSQVAFLIRGAIFRSRSMSRRQDRLSLDICTLGELVDLYHAHEATKRHDKVYALLGMCSDDLSVADLEPDYSVPWRELMQRLVKFLLGNHISVDTWDDKETAIIKGKGCVLGRVSKVDINNGLGGGQTVNVVIITSPGCRTSGSVQWLLQTTAKSIQMGDLVCLLRGASKPTIVRSRDDYFIIIAAALPSNIYTGDGHEDVEWSELVQSTSFIRDLVLVWDWETSLENIPDLGQYDVLMQARGLQSLHSKMLEHDMENAIRTWNVAQALGDVRAFGDAEERKQKATEFFEGVVRKRHSHSLECQCSQIPLLWLAENGYDDVVGVRLAIHNVDLDLKDYRGRTPLSCAVRNGHEGVIKLLLGTGKVDDLNIKDEDSLTLLLRAVRNGHEGIVKLLLETGKVDVDAEDKAGQTPLSLATENGHEGIVKLLLTIGKVNSSTEDRHSSQVLLSLASRKGHEGIVKLLLATGNVDVNGEDRYNGQTPLSLAAEKGHGGIVKLLLATSKVDLDAEDRYSGQTPLSLAAANGHESIVKLLLTTGKVNIDAKDVYGCTPLSLAVMNGYEGIVKLLQSFNSV